MHNHGTDTVIHERSLLVRLKVPESCAPKVNPSERIDVSEENECRRSAENHRKTESVPRVADLNGPGARSRVRERALDSECCSLTIETPS